MLSPQLSPVSALTRPELLAEPTLDTIADLVRDGREPTAAEIEVAEIDPGLADTAAFCDHYGIGLDESANCVVLAAKRAGEVSYLACVVLATTRADVNNLVRKHLGVRKLSFASMDDAVSLTGMEYGGITPIGLPKDWPILVDRAVDQSRRVVVGSGIRGSKLWVPGALLAALPNAQVLDGLGKPVEPRADEPSS